MKPVAPNPAPPANWRELLGEKPEPPIDRGPATQPVELYDEAAFAEFDAARNVDKGPTLARRDDQQAAALDWQALDVIRRAGL